MRRAPFELLQRVRVRHRAVSEAALPRRHHLQHQPLQVRPALGVPRPPAPRFPRSFAVLPLPAEPPLWAALCRGRSARLCGSDQIPFSQDRHYKQCHLLRTAKGAALSFLCHLFHPSRDALPFSISNAFFLPYRAFCRGLFHCRLSPAAPPHSTVAVWFRVQVVSLPVLLLGLPAVPLAAQHPGGVLHGQHPPDGRFPSLPLPTLI